MVFPNLGEMEEVACDECGRPLVATAAATQPRRYIFQGCRCNREQYDLPIGCIVAGFENGPAFFYRPRCSRDEKPVRGANQ